MLSIKQIEQNYPVKLQAFKKNILREYLQYKILEIIFNYELSTKLSFLGGTALRIIYDNTRFSEDLDFDNFGLIESDFSKLSEKIKTGLENDGYAVEINNIFKGAYRCKIKLPKILFENELSQLREEKIMIQVDTVPHDFDYQPEKKLLNKFDVFTQIAITPPDILLSQKIFAIFNRKRAKGRDIYDTVFLLSLTKPNYQYLEQKLKIRSGNELKKRLIDKIKTFDLAELSRDVESFLFAPSDSKKVKLFLNYIKQVDLG